MPTQHIEWSFKKSRWPSFTCADRMCRRQVQLGCHLGNDTLHANLECVDVKYIMNSSRFIVTQGSYPPVWYTYFGNIIVYTTKLIDNDN